MNYRKRLSPDKRRNTGRLGTRPDAGFDLKAARIGIGIGAALRALHSDVLLEEIPDTMAELVMQLQDKPMPRGRAENATSEVADG
jgi:hypothetical protein